MTYGKCKIISAILTDRGEIEVIRRYPSTMRYACIPPRMAPDRIVKEIYSVQDGVIALSETIDSTHSPVYTVPETIEF